MMSCGLADETAGASWRESGFSVQAPAESKFCRVSIREVGGSRWWGPQRQRGSHGHRGPYRHRGLYTHKGPETHGRLQALWVP